MQQAPGVQGVQLYAGEDFTTGTKPVPPAQAPGNVVAQTANDQTCQAGVGANDEARCNKRKDSK